MRKINRILVANVLFTLIGVVMAVGAQVYASAGPGCYIRTSGSISKVTCPNEGLTRSTSAPANKCYVTIASSSAQTDYKETDCTTITVGDSRAAPTSQDASQTLGEAPVGSLGEGTHTCGRGTGNSITTAFDFGCVGGDVAKYKGDKLNPIVDLAFALFRFLSTGVGLVVIGSIVVAGIQYTASRGDPQATAASIKRISNSLIALLIFIFMFAIANFLVPGGMFI